MSKNKEGFEVGTVIEVDDLLTHIAKQKQASKEVKKSKRKAKPRAKAKAE